MNLDCPTVKVLCVSMSTLVWGRIAWQILGMMIDWQQQRSLVQDAKTWFRCKEIRASFDAS